MSKRFLFFSIHFNSVHCCFQVDNETIVAHSCVLVACSDYFRTLLTGNFKDCKGREYSLPNAPHKAAEKVVGFMYTGAIEVSMSDVEDILSLADYFCMDILKEYCTTFLRASVTEENCLYVKMLADKFSLEDVIRDTIHFISPRIAGLLQAPESLELPLNFVIQLLKDPKFNYIREQEIFEFIIRWIKADATARRKHFSKLFLCVEMSYLPKSYLGSDVIQESVVTQNLGDDFLRVVRDNVADVADRNVEDVIICRSRSVQLTDEVCLYCYVIFDDRWVVLHTPEPRMFDGLESLLSHLDSLYFLVAKVEDIYGYTHHTNERKYFWRLDVRAGKWEQLSSPKRVRGPCRLVSHVNGIYVVDRTGMVEEYNVDSKKWVTFLEQGAFENPSCTRYVLPMPVDRYIYILRAFSAGYSFAHDTQSFRLFKYDTVDHSCESLSEIEAGEVDLDEHDYLHGYVARPGKLTMKNELGESRLRFHFADSSWSARKPRIRLPRFVAEVWGSGEWMDRVYFAGKCKEDNPVFMMYDNTRSRFKSTAPPPSYVSGLLCHVRMPKATVRKLQPEQS